MPEIDKDVQKEAIKEALREWLNEQYAAFGRWALHSLLAAAFAGCVYLALIGVGWKK